jgi:Protein of unknown function (DUF1376)
MTDLPEPLTPADCNLRGMPWMSLDVQRVIDSDLFGLSTGDEFKAAFRLWAKSWHQIPAASLPNDDKLLAHLAGLTELQWRKVRTVALRGWTLCSDGRLYHPVIAEKAREALGVREVNHGPGKPKTRMQKLREDRAALIAELNSRGIEPPPGVSMKELRALIEASADRVTEASRVTSQVTSQVTGDASHDATQSASQVTAYTQQNTTRNNVTNDDVGNLIRGGAVDKSAASSSLPIDEIAALLTQWECERGKEPRIRPDDAALKDLRVTTEQLRRIYDRAVVQRTSARDNKAINAGFIASIAETELAPPKVVKPPLSGMTSDQLVAEAERLGVHSHGKGRPELIALIAQKRTELRGGHAA